jgi:lipopolysaccharide export system permease protein
VSPTLRRYVVSAYLGTLAVTAAAVLVVFLVADFGDRLKAYLDRPLSDVAQLYVYKTAITFGQLMPAAMLLSAGICLTALKRRGELDAMRALGISPLRVLAPLLVCAVPIALGLMLFDERVASRAGAQLDRMLVEKFSSWGDYRLFHLPQQWLRMGPDVFRVGRVDDDGTLLDVSVLQVGAGFTLERRTDAETMRHLGDERWALMKAEVRDFTGGAAHLVSSPELTLRFPGAGADAFALKGGRPEQMSTATLFEQERLRAAAGLPTLRYALARHGRFSYPLLGVIGTVLAACLALRSNRRPQLTVALVEGLAVAASLWGLLVLGRALALGDRIPPAVASWGPAVLLTAVAALMLARLERSR